MTYILNGITFFDLYNRECFNNHIEWGHLNSRLPPITTRDLDFFLVYECNETGQNAKIVLKMNPKTA